MYCNVIDVRRQLPEVTAEIIQDSTVVYFIDEADAYIDDKLREAYTVPFTTVPTSIAKISAAFAAYLTLRTYPDQTVEEDLDRLYSDIMSRLSSYSSGQLSLGSDYAMAGAHPSPYFKTIRSDDYDSDRYYEYFDVDVE